MKKFFKLLVAAALISSSSSAFAKPEMDYKEHVIRTWCKNVHILNRFVFDCSIYGQN